ncbi:MAG: hypothetical protein ACOYNF_01100 [Rhodoferax sp.]
MHPLFALLATRPQLLVEHTLAYSALINQEFGVAYAAWRRQTVLRAVALCCAGVAWVLGGVALMLWAVTPAALVHAPWALWAMPLLPLAVAALCAWQARGPSTGNMFARLTRQIEDDMTMLRATGSP